jgi:hypothetical protein
MKKLGLIVFFLAILVFFFTSNNAIAAITYNAASDFSTTLNPNSPWSYRYAMIGEFNSTATLLDPVNGYDITLNTGWTSYSQFTLISSDNPWVTDEPPGTLFVHPGGDVDMLLQFQFPGDFDPNRPVQATITVADADTGGSGWAGSQNISFYKNENLISGYTVSDGWFAPFSLFSGQVQMGLSDILTVRVNMDEEFNYDGVYLRVQYAQQAVPIPAAVWLLGSGLIVLIGLRRKFSKR